MSVTHATFVIERHYPHSPERVFAAFTDPAKKRRWFAEGDHSTTESHEMDFRVGGTERTSRKMTAESPVKGVILTNLTVYQDIVPNERIVMAYTMSLGDYRMSASQATVELLADGNGTKLIFTEQGAYFPHSDGAAMRQDGWTKLLERLALEIDNAKR